MPQEEAGAIRRHGLAVAKALNAIANVAGTPFTKTTEEGRFLIQKAVYLLKVLNYPAARRFDFNIYLMGPYSPELTKCYYELEDDGIASAGVAKDIPPATRDTVVAALAKGHDFLEGLTTVIDVQRQLGHLPAALANAKAIKKHLDANTWLEVRTFLAAHRTLIAST